VKLEEEDDDRRSWWDVVVSTKRKTKLKERIKRKKRCWFLEVTLVFRSDSKLRN